MELIRSEDITVLRSDFQDSHQLLWNENSASERVTITKVFVRPGATNERHTHQGSEQIWVALTGEATLLLAGGETTPMREGDVARFAEGDAHGVTNHTGEVFVYLSVTSPPINFRYAYKPESPLTKA